MAVTVMAPVEATHAVEKSPQAALLQSSTGAFDGRCFYLRSFPIWYRWRQVNHNISASPSKHESGNINGVRFTQTMGRMELVFPLQGANSELDEDDFKVELSCWQVKVSAEGRAIPELSQDVYDDIHFDLSWWKVATDMPGMPGKCLVLYLSKLAHKAWPGPWFVGPLNPRKKLHFSWNAKQVSQEVVKALRVDSESLRKIDPGEPEDWSQEICTGLTPDQLCTGVDSEENARFIFVVVHLDEDALESATAKVPLEELFAANVTADTLVVFLRGDSFFICSGPLAGKCVPELTTWEISSVRRKKLPEGSDIKCPAFYNPAIRIRLVKAKGSEGSWGSAFEEMQSLSFQPPKERTSWSERVQRAMVLSPGAPLNGSAKAERAQALCTNVEFSQDLLLNRVIILFHLEEKLAEICSKFGVDPNTFFSMKVSERMIQVNVVADVEYTLCAGGLGGACVPDASVWELFTDQSLGKEHLVLKLSLAKAESSRGRWAEVFTRWKPWQVSAHMLEASKTSGQLEDDEPVEDSELMVDK